MRKVCSSSQRMDPDMGLSSRTGPAGERCRSGGARRSAPGRKPHVGRRAATRDAIRDTTRTDCGQAVQPSLLAGDAGKVDTTEQLLQLAGVLGLAQVQLAGGG